MASHRGVARSRRRRRRWRENLVVAGLADFCVEGQFWAGLSGALPASSVARCDLAADWLQLGSEWVNLVTADWPRCVTMISRTPVCADVRVATLQGSPLPFVASS